MAATKQNALYSQLVSAELAGKVLRIPGKHDAFATDFLGYAEQGEHPACVRLEAVQDFETKTWQIDRLTLLSSDENGAIKREAEVNGGLCFFDALHYCARFQMSEEAFGKQAIPVEDGSFGEMAHYKIAAASAGQAIDADGNVHPCAYGRPLTEGLFNRAAYAVALQTKDIDLSQMPKVQQTDFVAQINRGLLNRSVSEEPQQALITRTQDKNTQIKTIEGILEAGEGFLKMLEKVIKLKFVSKYRGGKLHGASYYWSIFADDDDMNLFGGAVHAYGSSVLTLGLLPAYRYLSGNRKYAPVRAVKSELAKFNRQVARLPDIEVKTLCMEFSKAATYSIEMERAAAASFIFTKTNSSSVLNEGLRLIEKAGALIDLGEADTNRIKALYLKPAIEPGSFSKALRNSWGGRTTICESKYFSITEDGLKSPKNSLQNALYTHLIHLNNN